MDNIKKEINDSIRTIDDFPIQGIKFKDITTLLDSNTSFQKTVNLWSEEIQSKFPTVNKIVALESRGFIFAAPIAYKLNCGLTLIRKKGKLPYKTHQVNYGLEYGSDSFEIHQDALKTNDNILILDDVLATGGSAQAALNLCQNNFESTILGFSFLMEIPGLDGAKLVAPHQIHCLL